MKIHETIKIYIIKTNLVLSSIIKHYVDLSYYLIIYDYMTRFHGPMLYAAVCKISSQSLHPLQNYCEMKTSTFVTMEHYDDVSDVEANLDWAY